MSGPPSIFDTPQSALPIPPSLRNYIQPNLGHGLRIWWAFFWPATLISAILTIGLNYWLRLLYENTDVPGKLLRPILLYDSFIFGYAVAFFVMNYILRKKFRHFRIVLRSDRGGEGSKVLDPTFRRTLRVWWAYSWRTFVYGLIAIFATTIPRAVLVGVFGRIPALEAAVSFLVSISIGGAVGLYVIYSNILDEDFGDFRVCLQPRQEETVAPAAPATTPATI